MSIRSASRQCGNPGCPSQPLKQGEVLKRCGACNQISYCGKECQRQAWKAHQAICPLLKNISRFGGSSLCLERLLSFVSPKKEAEIPFQPLKKEMEILSPAQFQQKTGKQYVYWWKGSPEALKEIYARGQAKRENDSLPPLSSRDHPVKEFESNPPKLCLEEHSTMGIGLSTLSRIREGAIIALYVGELIDRKGRPWASLKDRVKNCYFGDTDASQLSGLASFANDNPPNAAFGLIQNYYGVPEAPCLIALRDIEQGETIFVDYGGEHDVKRSHYTIDRIAYQKEIVNRLKPDFLLSIPTRIFLGQRPVSPYEKSLFFFILRTPRIFIRAHLDKTLSIEETRKMLDLSIYPQLFQIAGCYFPISTHKEILHGIELILKQNRGIESNLVEMFEKWPIVSSVTFLSLVSNNSHFMSDSSIESYPFLLRFFTLLFEAYSRKDSREESKENRSSLEGYREEFEKLNGKEKCFMKQITDNFIQLYSIEKKQKMDDFLNLRVS